MQLITAATEVFYDTHVYLSGKDVSADCGQAFVPDSFGVEAEGWALLVSRNEKGLVFWNADRTDIAREVVHGMIRWERLPKC